MRVLNSPDFIRHLTVDVTLEEYESLKEAIEILSNPKLMHDLRKAQREYNEGKAHDWEDLKKELDASAGIGARTKRAKKLVQQPKLYMKLRQALLTLLR